MLHHSFIMNVKVHEIVYEIVQRNIRVLNSYVMHVVATLLHWKIRIVTQCT